MIERIDILNKIKDIGFILDKHSGYYHYKNYKLCIEDNNKYPYLVFINPIIINDFILNDDIFKYLNSMFKIDLRIKKIQNLLNG